MPCSRKRGAERTRTALLAQLLGEAEQWRKTSGQKLTEDE